MRLNRMIQFLLIHPMTKSITKIGGFLVAGLPSFALAIPINWFLVTQARWSEAVAYALVLVVQVTLNFFMCRWFVFTDRKVTPMWVQFGQFMSGILFFRLADWALYTLLVSAFGFYFLAVQIANIFIFAVLKFKYSQRIMKA
jgi:putative flippase GtrA